MVAFVERQNEKIAELSQRLDDLLEQAEALLSFSEASQHRGKRCSDVASDVADYAVTSVFQSF